MPAARIAFYAPLKPPDHPIPSGDRQMARMLMAALINAGQYIRLDGKRQVSTAKSTTLPSFLELEDQELPLLYQEQGWSVDWAGGVNPNGSKNTVHRVMTPIW